MEIGIRTPTRTALVIAGFGLFAITVLILLYAIFQQWQFQARSKRLAHLPVYSSTIRFDPTREGGHLLPNLNMLVQGSRLAEPVTLITNSKGFRSNHEYPYEPPPGVFRILLLGDSYVDGMRTDQEDTIGRVLERFLNEHIDSGKYRGTEVLIAGNNNPANAWYYYQEHGHKYAPHLVILGVTLGNDITWHNFRVGVIPVSQNGRVTVRMVPGARQHALRKPHELMLPADAYVAQSIWDRPADYWFSFVHYLATKSDRFMYSVPPVTNPCATRRRQACAADYSTSLGLFYRPAMPEMEEMFGDFEAVLEGMSQRVRDDGRLFLAVLFPVRFQVSENDWTLLRRALGLKREKFDLSYPNERLKRYCTGRQIPCLDPTDEFRSRNGEHLYHPLGDMHFSKKGQEVTGQSIGEYVLNRFMN